MRWFAACFLSFAILADDVALIRVGEDWKFYKGASEPPAAWFKPDFDDSAWPLAMSGFSSGFGSDVTYFPDMVGNYLSVYFRKSFTVTDPKQVKWLTLRLDYSDGFVAYLNGQEIARRNLAGAAGSPVPYNAGATNAHRRAEIEEINVSAFAHLLVPGTNVLAMQVHNQERFDFEFLLVPELLANFTRGPFIQNASTNSVQVIWKTFFASDTSVEYGTNASLRMTLSLPVTNNIHAVTLTNLLPGTTYYYRAKSTAGDQTAISPIESFQTLKSAGSLSFVVLGDSGVGSFPQYQVARVMRSAKPDLVLHAGDIIYPSFVTSYADTRCLSVYGPHMRSTPYYFAIGNHDLYSGPQHFLDAFHLPTNSVSAADHLIAGTSPEHYYSFDHGDAHFAVVFVPYMNQYKLKVGDPQYQWLTNDLAQSSKPWKILLFHVPMETSSAHRFDDLDGNKIPDRLEIKEAILPIASRHGVQLIFAGHDHVYEKLNPTNGVHSIVTGGGGVGLYGLTELDPSSALLWSRHHCVRVTIEGDTLETQALGLDGQVFDSMTIQRRLPPPTQYAATWNSPTLESTSANDDQGNIFGQTFDLRGTPIPTLPGQFSSLGRAYVNNDRTNLYIGLDRVMIYGNNNVFLFIESPRLAGTTNLVNVGNGIVDPSGQGADGLDFLANLSFTNFAPSIACILGDEFGDAQSRSFTRTNLAFNIGQGVFKLDREISDLPGARLQQFNLSPQIGGAFGEENANFIEVSIPLRELGGLQPGDQIKIGAVVAAQLVETNTTQQTRFLDSGVLGYRLIGSGQGSVSLEGLAVKLAEDADPDDDGLLTERELAIGTDPRRADSDNDGLLDGWEVAHELNPLLASGDHGANGDLDRDQSTNADEQLAGTDPRNPRSALRVRIESTAKRTYKISWPAVIGKQYQLQIATNAPSGFANLSGTNFPMIATSPTLSFEEDVTQAAWPSRFYRVRLAP